MELEDFQDTSAYPESKWDFLIGLLLGYLLHSVLAFFFLLAVNFSRPRYDGSAWHSVDVSFSRLFTSFQTEMDVFLYDVIGLKREFCLALL